MNKRESFAGSLRAVITIQSNTPTRNTMGESVENWSTFATVPAAVKFIYGTEINQSGRQVTPSSYRFTIRYLPGVNKLQQVLWDGRTFDIATIDNPGQKNFSLVLDCAEVI